MPSDEAEFFIFHFNERIKYFEKMKEKAKNEHAKTQTNYIRGIIEGLIQARDLMKQCKD